jgi:hypothetical protein
MTTVAAAVIAIQKKFKTDFEASTPGVAIEFDNDPSVARVDPYVKLTIQVGPTNPSLDSGFERTTGIAMVLARVPKGNGDILAWSIAEQAALVLKYKTFDGVRLTSADFTNVGILGDALEIDTGWFQINVVVPWWIENYP